MVLFYIEKFGKQLPISNTCLKKGKSLVNKFRDYSVRFSGKNPRAIAGTLLYINAKRNHEHITYNEICIIAKTSQVTLRNRIKDICELNVKI